MLRLNCSGDFCNWAPEAACSAYCCLQTLADIVLLNWLLGLLITKLQELVANVLSLPQAAVRPDPLFSDSQV